MSDLIDKAEALAPCPFCGSKNVRSFLHIATQIDPCVMCRDCNSSAVSKSAWNRRAALKGAAIRETAQVERMQELIDAYEGIMDYGIVFAKKDQQDRLKAAKEKLK